MNSPLRPTSAGLVTRDEITGKHRTLEHNLTGYKPAEAVNALTQALRYFDDQSRVDREQLIKSNQTRTREEQATCNWIAERYGHLLRLARETVSRNFSDATAAADTQPARAPSAALAILLSGHAIKWCRYAGTRTDPATREWLHQIFRTALSFSVDAAVIPVRIEDRMFDATVETLYVRALLLDRFSSGNLSPRRLEILDNWLVAWMGALWLTREPALREPTLGINTTAPQRGLTPHAPGDGAQLFLGLRPLQRQLDRTIREFHHGNIFPGWGISISVPIEEHVAVIDFLEREFTLIDIANTQRAARGKRLAIAANSIVGVFFGFDEICSMAFSADRLHSLAGGGAELGIRNAIHLIDISEGGLGLEMVTEDARRVNVNDLIAVRLEKGRPCVIGVVVRKSPLYSPTASLVGVRVLSRNPLHADMERVDESNTWQPAKGILLAGAASNGFADSVLVSDKTYVANALMAVTLGSQAFEFRLRRVRQQGTGWRMAAYDAVVAS